MEESGSSVVFRGEKEKAKKGVGETEEEGRCL